MMRQCETPECGAVLPEQSGRGRPRKYCDECRARSAARDSDAAPWRLDVDALDVAAAHLGLTLPVYVRRTRGLRRLGAYKGIRPGDRLPDVARHLRDAPRVHYITVAGGLDTVTASRTLWHELAHALQEERAEEEGGSMQATYGMLLRAIMAEGVKRHAAYEALPWEVEARAAERFHDEVAALTIRTSSRRDRVRDEAGHRATTAAAIRAWEGYGENAALVAAKCDADTLRELARGIAGIIRTGVYA